MNYPPSFLSVRFFFLLVVTGARRPSSYFFLTFFISLSRTPPTPRSLFSQTFLMPLIDKSDPLCTLAVVCLHFPLPRVSCRPCSIFLFLRMHQLIRGLFAYVGFQCLFSGVFFFLACTLDHVFFFSLFTVRLSAFEALKIFFPPSFTAQTHFAFSASCANQNRSISRFGLNPLLPQRFFHKE